MPHSHLKTYTPVAPPPSAKDTPEDIAKWAHDELTKLSKSLTDNPFLQLNTLHVEPPKPREGMVISADGVDWDPNFGPGFYGYMRGGWLKLSGVGAVVNAGEAPYHALGDGVTDDSVALHAAVNAAYAANVPLYIPAGFYRITQSGVLTPDFGTNLNGIKIYGDGPKSTVLFLDTTGASADMYFYDNVATPRTLGNYYVDLGFFGMDPSLFSGYASISPYAAGFRQWATTATGSHEQNFHFSRCEFGFMNYVFLAVGDNTASENNWHQCEFFFVNTILIIANVQSFNHEFHSCNLSNIYGNTFYIPAGGGTIKMYGGSVILLSDSAADSFFLRVESSGASQGADPWTFNGIRFEFRGDTTNLVSVFPTCQVDINFNNCLFEDQGTVTKNLFVGVGSYAHLNFNKCTFYEIGGGTMLFETYDGGTYNQGGSIVFEGCAIPPDWSDHCIVTNYNQISARNCYGTNVGAETDGQHFAHDFDARADESNPGIYTSWTAGSGSTGGPTDNMLRLKTAQLLSGLEAWPANGNELQLKLPKNAIIKNLYLRKPTGGPDVTVCTLNVSRNDKSGTPHLVSDLQVFQAPHIGENLNYFYNVGYTDNERNLRLYTDVPTTGNDVGGFCTVEYY